MTHRKLRAAATAISVLICSAAWANPSVRIDFDLDADGNIETEGSILGTSFVVPAGGGVFSFDYAFLTSEAEENVHDVFAIGLITGNSSPVPGVTLIEITGAVDNEDPGSPYGGLYDSYNFLSGTVNGEAVLTVAGPIVAPAGGSGLMTPSVFRNGALGWNSVAIPFDASLAGFAIDLLIFVADTEDEAVDSGLALDNFQLLAATGGSNLLPHGGFENGLSGWSSRGAVGIYTALVDPVFGDPLLTATEGSRFVLLSTQPGGGDIPEPITLVTAVAAAGLMLRRRGRA